MELNTDSLTPMQLGKLQKTLDKLYLSDGGVMSLRDFVASRSFGRKSHSVEYLARHKTQGEYRHRKSPLHVFTIWDGDRGTDIPKSVYDLLDLPETVHDSPPMVYCSRQW